MTENKYTQKFRVQVPRRCLTEPTSAIIRGLLIRFLKLHQKQQQIQYTFLKALDYVIEAPFRRTTLIVQGPHDSLKTTFLVF